MSPIRTACTTQEPPEPLQNAPRTPPPQVPSAPHQDSMYCTPITTSETPGTPWGSHSLQLHRLHQLVQFQDLILQLVVQRCVLHDEQVQLLGGERG